LYIFSLFKLNTTSFYTSSDGPLVASYSNDVNSNLNSSISSVLFEHGLCLPSSPVLTQNDIERVVRVIKKTGPEIKLFPVVLRLFARSFTAAKRLSDYLFKT
ncbi:MAG: hypothetical protein WCR71_04015, partial [Bacteroidales bacterium]